MSTVTTARVKALQIMRAIRSGELADRAFVRLVDEVPPRERAWLHELVYGTLRLRGRLDYLLGSFVKRGVAKLDDDVLDILRLGAYQLLEMNSVPPYAAVSQSVELTRMSGKRSASGLVNGVLQSLRRDGAGIARDVPAWTSHPQWLLDRWQKRFGAEATRALADANNARPELYIRPVGIDVDGAIAKLESAGIVAERVTGAPRALRITEGGVGEVLAAAPAIVQDPAAGLVADYAQLRGLIADVCAAPGGKAIALADSLAEGQVVASDISAHRMQRLVDNRDRIGRLPLHVLVADAKQPVVRAADGVLIDAPCTGTGTFRRHPDGKWRMSRADLRALVALQREILDAAATIVKAGGVLVYSTCSLEDEENAGQVRAFLERQGGAFRLAPPPSWKDASQFNEDGMLMMLPHVHGFDGAFAARMERVA